MDQSPEFYRQLHALIFTSTFGVIGLNSLFLYLVIRNRVFVYYFTLVCGLTLHTSLPLLEGFNDWVVGKSSVITAMITVLGSFLFTRSFIGLDGVAYSKWNRVYDWLIGTVISIIVLQLTNILVIASDSLSEALSLFAALLALVSVILNISLSLSLWKQKQTARLYFLINIPMLLAAAIYTSIWVLQTNGQVGGVSSIRFFISGGMSLQMVLFSVFIGWKIKNFQREKLILEKDLNQKLKSEVEIQTESLRMAISEVNSQKEELKQTNDLKNKLFSLVAHDLRVPLNNLSGFVELLDADKIDEEGKDFILGQTRIDLQDSITVIDRLLQWSYKQLEGITVTKEVVELENLIAEVKAELKSLIENKQVKIDTALLVSDIQFDRNMLRVVIRNLISNAIKFSDEGSPIYISSERDANSVRLMVRDEGIGMNPQWYDSLIKEGRPDVKDGTKGEKGKGFGLLITKDFVEMNQGKLICQSEKNVGTTFIIQVPKSVP